MNQSKIWVFCFVFFKASLYACAFSCRYTYGKPVVGSVKAVVCRNAFRFHWYTSFQEHNICKTYELTVSVPDFFLKISCWSRSNYPYTNYVYIYWNWLSSRRIKVVVLHKLWTWQRLPSTRACTMTVLKWVLKWRSMAQVGWLNARWFSLSVSTSSWWAVICLFTTI